MKLSSCKTLKRYRLKHGYELVVRKRTEKKARKKGHGRKSKKRTTRHGYTVI